MTEFKKLTNNLNPPTQIDLLADHMLRIGRLTPMQAQHIYGVRSFHRRMADLAKLGFKFSKVRKKDNTGSRYVEYQFAGFSA